MCGRVIGVTGKLKGGCFYGVVIINSPLKIFVVCESFVPKLTGITRVRDKVSMQTVPTALIFQHKQAEPQVYCQKSNRLLGQNIGS